MKKIAKIFQKSFFACFVAFMLIQFSSCKKQNEVIVKWDITIDGQTYSYEETLSDGDELENGAALFQTNMGVANGGSQLILTSTDGADAITIQFAHINMTDEGSYVFNGGLDGAVSIMQNINAYADNSGSGASTTLNITTFPTVTASTSERLQETLVVGNFSGTVADFNDVLHDISGSFEAIRLQ